MGVRKLCAFLGAFFFIIIIIIIFVLLLSLYGCAEVVWCFLVTTATCSNMGRIGSNMLVDQSWVRRAPSPNTSHPTNQIFWKDKQRA